MKTLTGTQQFVSTLLQGWDVYFRDKNLVREVLIPKVFRRFRRELLGTVDL